MRVLTDPLLHLRRRAGLTPGTVPARFAGATAGFRGLGELHPRLGVAVEVGDAGPRLRGRHLDPAAVADCLPLLGCRAAVPTHYGTMLPVGLDRLRRRRSPGRPARFRPVPHRATIGA